MSDRDRPPYRADHVGSLLRPPALIAAREAHGRGEITFPQLRAAEDDAVRGVVRIQEAAGLRGITDGEMRRTFRHVDFLTRIEGVREVESEFVTLFRRADGTDVDVKPNQLNVTKALGRPRGIQTDDFAFLRAEVARADAPAGKRRAKVAIPSPSILHFRGGRAAIDEVAYPRIETFFDDLARVYNEEIIALADLGCRYLQIDDTNFAYLCDPMIRESVRRRGDDPDGLVHLYA